MKNSTLAILFSLLNLAVSAQLRNYDANGNRIKLSAEKIIVQIDKSSRPSPHVSVAVSAIGSLLNIGTDIITTAAANRETSFTAGYDANVSGSGLMINNSGPGFQSIHIYRVTQDLEGKKDTASKIALGVDYDRNVFRLTLDTLDLSFAKARIRKAGNDGKAIDMNIDIKIDAIWNDHADAGKPMALKSMTLGESSITVFGVRPGQSVIDPSNTTAWYPFIPKAFPSDSTELHERGWYTITVTVKEVNPYGLTFRKRSDFFANNATDITALVKQVAAAVDAK